MINEVNLQFWIKNSYNVLFRGKHGVGKTATILQAFADNGLKYQYFSASTMDPWVDFIGVPKEKTDENGNSYLDLVRPKHFQNDEVEAIFLDEFNRSSKKVRNAVMELIQFKSINGKKFNNLKIIWAAINPEDDEEGKYDVEALDPAQLDRFHVVVDVPYLPQVSYFRKKYGATLADSAITWWKELSNEQKNLVSPRRLDYALDIYSKGGDLKFVLPKSINTNKLILELSSGSISKKLKSIFDSKNKEEATKFLSIENNYAASVNYFLKSKEYQEFFLPLLSEEKIIGLMTNNKDIESFVFSNLNTFETMIKSLADSDSSALAKRAAKALVTNLPKNSFETDYNKYKINNFMAPPLFKNLSAENMRKEKLNENFNFQNTYDRKKIYDFYLRYMPAKLEEDVAKQAVQDLTQIAVSSQAYTVESQMQHLIRLLNHSIQYFIKNKKPVPASSYSLDVIRKKYKGNFIYE